jgi:excisionase family DNA binding protein
VLLTVEEACEFLRVSKATVYRLIHKGLLSKRKLPRDRQSYIPLNSLENYRQAQSYSLEELALKVLTLERTVARLEHQSNRQAAPSKATKTETSLKGLEQALRKHHPEAFN